MDLEPTRADGRFCWKCGLFRDALS